MNNYTPQEIKEFIPKPLISVIVAVYNGEKTLQRCINSVYNQTYPRKELIIIDGGSTDRSVDILRASDDKITYWKSEPDKGIYHAWNKALDHIQGDWICFLGADDYFWKTDVLERVKEYLVEASNTGIRVVYGQVAEVTIQGEILQILGKPWEKARKQFLQVMAIPHPGLMHHRSLFDLYGKFDEDFHIAGDYEFLLRELKAKKAEFITNIIVTGMQRGGVSSNPKSYLQIFDENTRAQRKNKVSTLIPIQLTRRYVKVILRKFLISLFGDNAIGYFVDFYRLLTGRSRYWTR